MKTQAIIPTAGIGTRFNTDKSKPFVELGGKPLCVYALEAFEHSPVIDSIIVVGHQDRLEDFKAIVTRNGFKKIAGIVAGGETRRKSVANGMAILDDDTDMVVVHDGARPLVSLDLIKNVVEQCQDHEAAISAVAVKPTIKKVNSESLLVEETLNRDSLWEVQTPQAFKKDVLMKAHVANQNSNPTDDAAMVEQLGVKVKVVAGDYKNIKVTTPEDLVIAEAFLKTEMTADKT